MKLSARNVLTGTVASITKGAVNAEVVLNLKCGPSIAAIITNSSVDSMGLKVGAEASAIIKASNIIVGTDVQGKISARNIFCGTVTNIADGQVSAEVAVDIGAGTILTAVITEASAKNLALKKGSKACLIIKASGIILGV
ncbi:MAG: TOBE domain-containing protein [Desulfuromonadales bacterium]|nr:TOBE domain-containing protein [Desulfuromonadales bacterium]